MYNFYLEDFNMKKIFSKINQKNKLKNDNIQKYFIIKFQINLKLINIILNSMLTIIANIIIYSSKYKWNFLI